MSKYNVGGSTVDWVMKTRGVSFRLAVELLRGDHHSLAAGDGHVVRQGTTAKLPSRSTPTPANLERRRRLLPQHPEGIARSAALSRIPRPHRPRDGRPLPVRLRHRQLALTLPDKNRNAGAYLPAISSARQDIFPFTAISPNPLNHITLQPQSRAVYSDRQADSQPRWVRFPKLFDNLNPTPTHT